jgi:hypothetical protein
MFTVTLHGKNICGPLGAFKNAWEARSWLWDKLVKTGQLDATLSVERTTQEFNRMGYKIVAEFKPNKPKPGYTPGIVVLDESVTVWAIRNTDSGKLQSQIIKGPRGKQSLVVSRFMDMGEAKKWLVHCLVMLGEGLGGIKEEDAPGITFDILRRMGFEFVDWATCPENK